MSGWWIAFLVVVGVLAWAEFSTRREDRRAREQDQARAARALARVASAEIPLPLRQPLPRKLVGAARAQPEVQAFADRLLQHGEAHRAVILSVVNTTDEDGFGPDVVDVAFRDGAGEVRLWKLNGAAWMYGGRPSWCRVGRAVTMLHDPATQALHLYEDLVDDPGAPAPPKPAAPAPAAVPTPSRVADQARGTPASRLGGRPVVLRSEKADAWFQVKPGDDVVLGRAPPADLVVNSGALSRRHVRLVHDGDTLMVEDLGSTGGTWLNGVRIRRGTLGHGDQLMVGGVPFVVEVDVPSA